MAPTKLILSIQLLLSLLSLSSAGHIPAVIVFGDSTVDTGNNNVIGTVLKSNFPPYGRDFTNGIPTGRFCNGRLSIDFISEALGLPTVIPAYLDPNYGIEDFAKGVSFASAGTGLDNTTSNVLSVIPLWKEVEYFKDYQKRLSRYFGQAHAKYIINEAVYIISIGTNDFLENYFLYVTGRIAQFTVDQYQDFLVGLAKEFVTEIYRLGARKISFAGLSALGCLPLERTTNVMGLGGCNENYNNVFRDFNVKLQRMIGDLNAKLPGLKLRYAPVYDSFLRIVNEPNKYGIENVKQGCCATTGLFEMGYLCSGNNPLTCSDADMYMFWDAFHPTEKVNRLMANLILHTSLREFI